MKRSIVVVLSVALILVFLFVPIAYGFSTLNTIRQLRIHSPSLSVTRDGWDIRVSLSFVLENPTDNIVPTVSLICECRIDNNVLFYAEQNSIGSLNPHSSITVALSTTINVDLAVDLFQSLIRYLLGEPVSYFLHITFVVHLFLLDYTIFEVGRQGEFELY